MPGYEETSVEQQKCKADNRLKRSSASPLLKPM
jgi:hypothetical protein